MIGNHAAAMQRDSPLARRGRLAQALSCSTSELGQERLSENPTRGVKKPNALRDDHESVLPTDDHGWAGATAVAGKQDGHRNHEHQHSQHRKKCDRPHWLWMETLRRNQNSCFAQYCLANTNRSVNDTIARPASPIVFAQRSKRPAPERQSRMLSAPWCPLRCAGARPACRRTSRLCK
jgi:hypothetical protein